MLEPQESILTTDLASRAETTGRGAKRQTLPARAALADRSFAEFFAGIGLVRLALESRGWSASFANDIDPKKYEMYADHFGDDAVGHYVVGDVHQLDAATVPTVTLATASFPCTDLSLAGGRSGLAGKESGSLFGFLRVLRDMGERRPPLILLENVPGFLSSHGGADFRQTLLELNGLGYAVDAFVLDALSFVPQSRVRLFVVGVRTTSGVGTLADLAAVPESVLRPRALWSAITADPRIRLRIQDLPNPPTRHTDLTDVLEKLPDDAPEWWSAERAEYLLNQMSERHRRLADHMIAAPTVSYGTVFRRVRNNRSMAELRVDGIAGCLRTPKGGSGRQILFKGGQGKYAARLLTARECARLQGAPDSFVTKAPLNQALFGFGDAVCVPAVAWIAEHYLDVVVAELLQERVLISA